MKLNFNSLRLSYKIRAGLGGIIIFVIILGTLSFLLMKRMNYEANEISKNWLPSVESILEIKNSVNEIRTREYRHILSMTDAEMRDTEKVLDESIKSMEDYLTKYEALLSSDQEKSEYNQFKAEWKAFMDSHLQLIEISRKNLTDSAKLFIQGDSRKKFNQVKATLDKLVETAAASEELATSAEELSGQADQLKEVIMYFKV